MSSTYSSSLRVELIGSGDQAGAWGATTDNSFAYVFDTAIAGYQAVPITSTSQALTYVNGATATANLNQAVYAMLKFTGASAATSVYIPPVSKQYILYNNSGYTITVYNSTVIGNTTAAGSGVSIVNGDAVTVWSDGTNVYGIKSSGVSGTLPIANGGTGQTTAVAAFNALSTNAVYIDGSSNVGIGTTSPSAKLDVTGSIKASVSVTSASDFIGGGASGYAALYGNSTGGVVICRGSSSTNDIEFYTNNAERMRIDSSGNVGIGTSSPGVKLDVNGALRVGLASNPTTIASNSQFYDQSGVGPTISGYNFTVRTGNPTPAETFRVDSAGNVGIGTTGNLYGFGRELAINAASGTSGYSYGIAGSLVGLSYCDASNMYIGTYPANPLIFRTSNTERMRIDSSGNVGIANTSPVSMLDLSTSGGDISMGRYNSLASGQSVRIGIAGNSGSWADNQGSAYIAFKKSSVSSDNEINFATYDPATGSSVKMVFDKSGNLLVNATAQIGQGKLGVAFVGSTNQAAAFNETSGASSWTTVLFQRSTVTIGSISNATSSTAYNTSSDYRLKNSIAPMTGALAKVAQLKPVTYKWNIDNEDGEGFIAHELAEVCPHAVTGAKDAVDEEGNPVYQGIDTSFLVATLTAAIQEQQSLIQSLTTRITALETK
jgi:hypothetical protein